MAVGVLVRAVLKPDEDGFHAFCPGLPGCHTWGSTEGEVLANLQEAASLCPASSIAYGEPILVECHCPVPASEASSRAPFHHRPRKGRFLLGPATGEPSRVLPPAGQTLGSDPL